MGWWCDLGRISAWRICKLSWRPQQMYYPLGVCSAVFLFIPFFPIFSVWGLLSAGGARASKISIQHIQLFIFIDGFLSTSRLIFTVNYLNSLILTFPLLTLPTSSPRHNAFNSPSLHLPASYIPPFSHHPPFNLSAPLTQNPIPTILTFPPKNQIKSTVHLLNSIPWLWFSFFPAQLYLWYHSYNLDQFWFFYIFFSRWYLVLYLLITMQRQLSPQKSTN